ncbi:unnamed protein product [Lactuca saligna]|uniref:SET domain-containing protein n=1 Tax=Lactuca saligna TaxID=75948 RepID=A0AA35Z5T1_LACSI|nr:unnamed protein product [Lactuca saligna]
METIVRVQHVHMFQTSATVAYAFGEPSQIETSILSASNLKPSDKTGETMKPNLKKVKYNAFQPLQKGDYIKEQVIDACAKGNLGHFINHSFQPNCRTEKWMVNGEVCIGLVAIRDIKKALSGVYAKDLHVRLACLNATKCIPAISSQSVPQDVEIATIISIALHDPMVICSAIGSLLQSLP